MKTVLMIFVGMIAWNVSITAQKCPVDQMIATTESMEDITYKMIAIAARLDDGQPLVEVARALKSVKGLCGNFDRKNNRLGKLDDRCDAINLKPIIGQLAETIGLLRLEISSKGNPTGSGIGAIILERARQLQILTDLVRREVKLFGI